MALATLVIGLAACGGDDGDENTAQAAANGTPRSGARDLDRYLMQGGEEPGFRPGAAPGATPSSGGTITGVRAFVEDMHLPQADAQRLRREGFISFTSQPIRGPRTAGISNVALFATAEGAKHNMAHELRTGRHPRVWPRRKPPILHRPRHSRCPRLDRLQAACRQPLVGAGSVRARPRKPGSRPVRRPVLAAARAIYQRSKGQCP